jgi:FtsP/CotA-like multicopper oxidase with cupredoxin domain
MSEERTVGAIATLVLALIAMVFAAGALILAAQAGGGAPAAAAADTTAGTTAAEVAVSLSEFAITPAAIEIAEGGTLQVTNDGAAEHDLAVVGSDVATPMLRGGESATLSLAGLAPGTYELHCTISGHDTAGMTGTLTVVASNGAATPASDDGHGGHGDHGADTDWAALDAAMHDTILEFPAETEGRGNQLLEPVEILEDGTKRFELTAEIIEWELEPGKFVEGWSYNGQIPGPMIKLDVGDDVQVDVTNELPMGTDVHWHGIIIPNDMDGVAPLTQPLIAPGETFSYRFTAEEPAVAMYHPHHHGQMKLPNGMFGVLLIGDVALPEGRTIGGRELPETIEVAQEIPMVLNDAGTIGLSLNGKSFPATDPIVAEQGDWIVVHYYNEGLDIHPMHLHGMPQLVYAKDGFPLDAPQWEDTVNVAPGERYSVLIPADHQGVWAFHCHILTHAERAEGMFGMVTALIVQ